MKLRTLATDIGAFTYGFAASDPDKSAIWELLGNSPILQDATGEVFKLASGVILTVVSKLLFSWIEKRRTKRKASRQLPPETIPIPETLKINKDDLATQKDSKKET